MVTGWKACARHIDGLVIIAAHAPLKELTGHDQFFFFHPQKRVEVGLHGQFQAQHAACYAH